MHSPNGIATPVGGATGRAKPKQAKVCESQNPDPFHQKKIIYNGTVVRMCSMTNLKAFSLKTFENKLNVIRETEAMSVFHREI